MTIRVRRRSFKIIIYFRISIYLLVSLFSIYSLLNFLIQSERDFQYLKYKVKIEAITTLSFYDKYGRFIEKTRLTNANRQPLFKINLQLKNIDPHFIEDLLIFEDHRFYRHNGVDFISTFYSFFRHVIHRSIQRIYNFSGNHYRFHQRGGSTITQQTVKMLMDNPDRNLLNKAKEIYLAMRLEEYLFQKYENKNKTKQKILELYLNNVYTGYQTRGIITASMILFQSKNVKKLSSQKRILLLSMIHAPGIFYRGNTVLKESIINKVTSTLMKHHRIFHKSKIAILTKNFRLRYIDIIHKHAKAPSADYVRTWVQYHRYIPGRKILTCFDKDLSNSMDRIFNRTLKNLPRQPSGLKKSGGSACSLNGAFVLVHIPSNSILALGETKCSAHNELMSQRQISSTIKPFIYMAAMDQFRWNPNYTLNDSRISLHTGSKFKYAPDNFYHFQKGTLTLKSALKFSSNTVSLKILNAEGVEHFYEILDDLFSTSEKFHKKAYYLPVYSLALGTLETNVIELARAYTTILNSGRLKPLCWHKTKADARSHKKVFSTRSANQMKDMLTGVAGVLGTGRFLSQKKSLIAREIGGKSGSNQRDSWFAGYTQDLLLVVWLGKNKETKEAKIPHSVVVWYELMKRAVEKYPQKKLRYPQEFERRYYCQKNGSFDINQCKKIESSVFLE